MRWPKQKIFLLLFVFLLLFLPPFPQANGPQSFTGKVVGVSDGDTIKVMREGRAVKVRLHGIDCPEKKQPYGTKAKRFTSDRAFRNEVTVRVKATDRYGRTKIPYRPGNGGECNAGGVRKELNKGGLWSE